MTVKQVRTFNLESSPGFPILLKVNNILRERGIPGYLVGGYIRDSILRRATVDIDIALPELDFGFVEYMADSLKGRFVLLDEANRVTRIVLLQEGQEPWHLDFSSLRGTIEEDLTERDFTINSLAVPLQLQPGPCELKQVSLIDPCGGMKDMEDGIIRIVSPQAFQKDPVRLLRAFRFAAELNFQIENETAQLITRNAHLLKSVAGERVRLELVPILEAANTYSWLRQMDRLGLLEVLFPELITCRGVEQPKEHYWDVFNHSLETVRAVERLFTGVKYRVKDPVLSSVPWTTETSNYFSSAVDGGATRAALLKLSALLHDIAKPQTRTLDGERWRFLGHAEEGAAITEAIMERLRFSRREINIVKTEVQHHLRPGQLGQQELPTQRAIYRYFRDVGEVALDTLYLGLADHLATRGPNLDVGNWQEHSRTIAYILEEKQKKERTIHPPKLIDGHDLMKRFDIKPGPELGRMLEEIREAQAAGEITTKEEAFATVKQKWGLS
jgi:poly(A) polymerase